MAASFGEAADQLENLFADLRLATIAGLTRSNQSHRALALLELRASNAVDVTMELGSRVGCLRIDLESGAKESKENQSLVHHAERTLRHYGVRILLAASVFMIPVSSQTPLRGSFKENS
jgi:hypothetical protein